jgi:cytidine deaminase
MNKTPSAAQKSERFEELKTLALEARKRAYCRYSGHQVGAAILLSDGSIFQGCNVENSSYGATLCAERVAVHSAVAHKGPEIRVREIVVATDATPPWPPCGMCRQVVAEFQDNAVIHAVNPQGDIHTWKFEELLPHAFTPNYLSGDSK